MPTALSDHLDTPRTRLPPWCVRVPAAVVLAVAAANWAGWATGDQVLTRVFSGSPAMVPWTSLCLAMLAVAVLLHTDASARTRIWAGRGLALAVSVLALTFLVEYATSRSFGLDEWWFSQSVRIMQPDWPGRPSPRTAWSLLPLSVAFALLRVDRRSMRAVWAVCLFAAVIPPLITGTGYLFGATSLVQKPGETGQAAMTTACLLLLFATALAARPDRYPVAWMLARPDRRALVRLVTILAGLPLLVGLSRVTLMTIGLREDSAWALGTVLGAIVVGVAVFFASQREQKLLIDRETLSRERAQAESERAEADARYRILAENSVDIVSHLRDGEIVWTSPSSEAAFGWPPEEWIGVDFVGRMHPDDRDVVVAALQELAAGGSTLTRFRLIAADGTYHWVESHAKPYIDAAGRLDGTISSSRIIDDRVEAERRLDRLARIDTLTGLANRGETIARLESALTCSRNPGTELGVLFCDIDSFKAVNDTLGHGVGDAVLVTLADRICECVRHGDTVGRTGGDEILVLLPGLHNLEEASRIAEKILRRAAEPIHEAGHTVHPTMSIGATLAIPGESVTEMTARADAAMYQAKRMGGNTVSVIEGTGPEGSADDHPTRTFQR